MRKIASPGLGDAILTVTWNKGIQLAAPPSYHRKDLYDIMGVDVAVCEEHEQLPLAGHGWPVEIKPLPKSKEKPLIKGDYFTCQFNTRSQYQHAPKMRAFADDEIERIKLQYGNKFVSLEDRSIDLRTAKNYIENSVGHVGTDSGMAWFAILCGSPAVDVWYNGWEDPSKFDSNWMHNYSYNHAAINFFRRRAT